MSSLSNWIQLFRGLHERARQNKLGPGERETYEAARDELARALVAMQKTVLKPGEIPRQALRVPRAAQVELDLPHGRERAMTVELGAAGFTALLNHDVPASEEIFFKMKVAGSEVTGRVKPAGSQRQGQAYRVSFAFQNLPAIEKERVEMAVYDTVLDQLHT